MHQSKPMALVLSDYIMSAGLLEALYTGLDRTEGADKPKDLCETVHSRLRCSISAYGESIERRLLLEEPLTNVIIILMLLQLTPTPPSGGFLKANSGSSVPVLRLMLSDVGGASPSSVYNNILNWAPSYKKACGLRWTHQAFKVGCLLPRYSLLAFHY